MTALDQTILDTQDDLRALVSELRAKEAAAVPPKKLGAATQGATGVAAQLAGVQNLLTSGHFYIALLATLLFLWSAGTIL